LHVLADVTWVEVYYMSSDDNYTEGAMIGTGGHETWGNSDDYCGTAGYV
jgi:hypothetical protein